MGIEARKVGILGGGQLSYMLAEAAIKLGLHPVVLVLEENEPCAQYLRISNAGTVLVGWEKLPELAHQVEVIVFENEFVDLDRLGQLKVIEDKFKPSLFAIGVLQDKFSQKEILTQLKIPTAPYQKVEEKNLPDLMSRFLNGCVLKWSRMGYDGKGVLFVPNLANFDKLAIHKFFAEGHSRGASVYAEEKVEFERELAIIGVRWPSGEFTAYPLVVSEQQGGVCKRVWGPATTLGVSHELELKAQHYAQRVAEKCGLVGSFALEFFETASGDLWVNEIAPRVHNSGHYTQEAANLSQFEMHWISILQMPRREIMTSAFFGMLNLLGPVSSNPNVVKGFHQDFGLRKVIEEMGLENDVKPKGVSLQAAVDNALFGFHGYAKTQLKPGRKMGHVNFSGAYGADVKAQVTEFFNKTDLAWQQVCESL